MDPRDAMLVKFIVYGGWLASLSLHEFGHGIVAFLGGDRDIRRRGYLTLNPFRFMDPLRSFMLPMLFLLIGGLGLPGGATYVDRRALRGRGWGSAVSLAGPAANLLVAVLLALLFVTGLVDPDTPLGAGIACLAALQVSAMLFNLIPFPGLDGFGALRAYLPPALEEQGQQLLASGYMLLVMAMWLVPPLNDAFWQYIYTVSDALHIPAYAVFDGFQAARFW